MKSSRAVSVSPTNISHIRSKFAQEKKSTLDLKMQQRYYNNNSVIKQKSNLTFLRSSKNQPNSSNILINYNYLIEFIKIM